MILGLYLQTIFHSYWNIFPILIIQVLHIHNKVSNVFSNQKWKDNAAAVCEKILPKIILKHTIFMLWWCCDSLKTISGWESCLLWMMIVERFSQKHYDALWSKKSTMLQNLNEMGRVIRPLFQYKSQN